MENHDDICAMCHKPLTDHQVLFDQRIERMEYLPVGPGFQAMAFVLYADDIGCYCSTTCADVGITKGLQELGIARAETSIGPITNCGKCGSIIDMIQPHVHYVQMGVTLSETPSQKTMTVTHDSGLGYVCANCDPDAVLLAASEQEQPITQEETSLARA
ncbi:hypothetical protein ABXJ76_03810 [Methylobacter sp. G7]|uniref:hypothetical protein n=1 Tax=Methylobacter sp. G7 TaxID=3230117 RepID=UPI003D803E96